MDVITHLSIMGLKLITVAMMSELFYTKTTWLQKSLSAKLFLSTIQDKQIVLIHMESDYLDRRLSTFWSYNI